jgi:4-hydroxybenzoate polyprenyltransferase
VRTDLLHEAILTFAKTNLSAVFLMLFWLLRGRLTLKNELARHVTPNVAVLPFRTDLIDYLKSERGRGRDVYLVTASPRPWAEAVAAHLGIFSGVMSSVEANEIGRQKARRLTERFGYKGFDYIGDCHADLHVWRAARVPHFAGSSGRNLARRLSSNSESKHFSVRASRVRATIVAARPHQWSKNLLLFVSPLAAHDLTDLRKLISLALAFVAFSLLASATYLVNDMLDLESDRRHPRKVRRPFASGALSIRTGLVAAGALFTAALLAAWVVGWPFIVILLTYLVITLGYSLKAKTAAIVDVITLASLYTLRIIAGTVAVQIPISSWLLAFSMFCFIALAVAKRCGEITGTNIDPGGKIVGRGYFGLDLEVLASMGVASSFCAVLVLCIYTTQPYVQARYASPELLWLVCPLILYALNRILMMARRGHMADDPIIFCARDKITIRIGLCMAVIVGLAAVAPVPVKIISDIGGTMQVETTT